MVHWMLNVLFGIHVDRDDERQIEFAWSISDSLFLSLSLLPLVFLLFLFYQLAPE